MENKIHIAYFVAGLKNVLLNEALKEYLKP